MRQEFDPKQDYLDFLRDLREVMQKISKEYNRGLDLIRDEVGFSDGVTLSTFKATNYNRPIVELEKKEVKLPKQQATDIYDNIVPDFETRNDYLQQANESLSGYLRKVAQGRWFDTTIQETPAKTVTQSRYSYPINFFESVPKEVAEPVKEKEVARISRLKNDLTDARKGLGRLSKSELSSLIRY